VRRMLLHGYKSRYCEKSYKSILAAVLHIRSDSHYIYGQTPLVLLYTGPCSCRATGCQRNTHVHGIYIRSIAKTVTERYTYGELLWGAYRSWMSYTRATQGTHFRPRTTTHSPLNWGFGNSQSKLASKLV